ncbi:hypothetical protein [Massilia scottii]|uniref:hypothetical protein n=1 Tax=Massilia scottii TaxID=3057166 RepID=UPI002796DD1B|nr:hypothetical protein [Massilia sp. CCM 9029]MDQ1835413.1 hypothetical protein [Massilia sp. CCM 9029]
MSNNIKKLSLAEAKAAVEDLAMRYAATHGVEGRLLDVRPDHIATDPLGKTPVHWIGLFESRLNGALFDGPLIVHINLRTGQTC